MTEDAGEFGTWLAATLDAQRGAEAPAVPCGECTACCTASQFVQIQPNETKALDAIDPQLLFDAPGAPPGTKLMGYSETGECPQFGPNGCAIYAARPRTCRQYDCRVFAATDISLEGDAQASIADRVSKWTFTYASDDATAKHVAVKAAATFLREKGHLFERPLPPSEILRAQVAIRVHSLFMPDADDVDDASLALAIVALNREFD